MTTTEQSPSSDRTERADSEPDLPDPSDLDVSDPRETRDPAPGPAPALGGGPRPRLVATELTRDQGSNAIIRVVLERAGIEREAEQRGIGEETVIYRCAALATLKALHGLIDRPGHFELVGVKRVPAFDASVVLACVRTTSGRPRKLIGCVPLADDPIAGVAQAVLHATNRVVEAMPAPEAGNEAGSEDATAAGTQAQGRGGDESDPGLSNAESPTP